MSRVQTDREFADFVAGRSSRLLLLAQHLCGDDDTAENLTRAVLEKAYLSWGRLSKTTDPYLHVRRVLVGLCMDAAKPAPANKDVAAVSADGAHVVTTSARHLNDEDFALLVDRIALRRTLAGLTPRERAVVVLRYLEDVSDADIAWQMGMKVAAVKSCCSRALSAMGDSQPAPRKKPHHDD